MQVVLRYLTKMEAGKEIKEVLFLCTISRTPQNTR